MSLIAVDVNQMYLKMTKTMTTPYFEGNSGIICNDMYTLVLKHIYNLYMHYAINFECFVEFC